ncbi:MAG TPA: type II toxin-antitoxin system HicB family antitoxin [Thermoanaerobaculia bacterium]|nr:type II toxin-antitoxin system HicB family antitoxin [Thermoanaerobaculia bacterium]
MKILYPANVKKQKPSGYFVQFPDIEEAITQGETIEEALFNASEVLSLALDHRLERDREIPLPSRPSGRAHWVAPDAKTQAAILVRLSRGDRSVADLARVLGTSWPAVARLENPRHSPTLRNLERTAAALGQKLIVSFEPTLSVRRSVDQRPARRRSSTPT